MKNAMFQNDLRWMTTNTRVYKKQAKLQSTLQEQCGLSLKMWNTASYCTQLLPFTHVTHDSCNNLPCSVPIEATTDRGRRLYFHYIVTKTRSNEAQLSDDIDFWWRWCKHSQLRLEIAIDSSSALRGSNGIVTNVQKRVMSKANGEATLFFFGGKGRKSLQATV